LTLLASGVPEKEAALQVWSPSYADGGHYKEQPNMPEAIANIRDGMSLTSQITKDDVMQGFKDSAEMARMLEDPQAMLAAYREIGKMLGFYEPQVTRHEVELIGLGEYDKMSDKMLLEMAGESDAITLAESEYEVITVEVEDDDTPES
jgi:hypothetical protein